MNNIIGIDGLPKETQTNHNSSKQTDVMDCNEANFMEQVVQESLKRPVLVDFWASWCAPCKQLGPIIEKLVIAKKGKIKLVKIDIETNQQIAGQLKVKSIPSIIVFIGGSPVDGFVGAQPENIIKQFIDKAIDIAKKHLKETNSDEVNIEEIVEKANEYYLNHDIGSAMSLFQQILTLDKDNLEALSGLSRCYLDEGEIEKSKSLLSSLDENSKKNISVSSVLSAIEIKDVSKTEILKLKKLKDDLSKNTKSANLNYSIGRILVACNNFSEGCDYLFESLSLEKNKEKRQAQPLILKIIESFAYDQGKTSQLRRQMSSILFS